MLDSEITKETCELSFIITWFIIDPIFLYFCHCYVRASNIKMRFAMTSFLKYFLGTTLFFFSFVNTLPSLKFKKVQNNTKMWLKVKCSVMFFLISWWEIFSFLASCAPYFFCHESWKIHIQFENFLLVTNSYENSFAKQHQFDLTPTLCLSCSFFVPSVWLVKWAISQHAYVFS